MDLNQVIQAMIAIVLITSPPDPAKLLLNILGINLDAFSFVGS